MSTIMPESRKVRDAIKWVDAEIQDGRAVNEALQEVGMRFNLGPKDERFIHDFFTDKLDGKASKS
ncbi:MAG: hypothetical protein ACQES5_07210 [Thermodesulfobacteriota bacterium]